MNKIIVCVAALSAVWLTACVDDEDTAVADGSAGASGVGAGGSKAGSAGAASSGASGAGAGGAGAGGAGGAGAAGKSGAGGGAGKAGASGAAGGAGVAGTAGASGAAGGAGVAGTAGASGAAGSAGTAGGAGGGGSAGMAGGAGSAGSGGSTAASCLDESAHASILTLSASTLCVTRVVTTNVAVASASPSWGTHGGPLTSSSSQPGEVELTRWALPSGSMGAATAAKTTVKPSGLPTGMLFWGGAVDVAALDGTLLSYTTSGGGFTGEVLLFSTDGASEKSRAHVNGFFSGLVLGGATPRLVYTGLSTLASVAPAGTQNGLWAGDYCGGFVTSCAPPAQVGAWGASSGPVVADGAGAVFVDQSTFGGDHEIRGFTADELKTAKPGAGASMRKNANFVGSQAALRPSLTDDGWLFVAESDATTFASLPVAAVRYAAGAPAAGATVSPAISAAKAGAQLTLFGDGSALWIAVDTATGGAFVEVSRR